MTLATPSSAREQAPPALIGSSTRMQQVRGRLARFGPTTLPVLLVGPTGSGKELAARHVHHLSGRPGALVDVNCGALPKEMIESLLFGHRRGAFTGAFESVSGMVSRAHRGTLFLDELGSLPLEGQAKLLRFLDTGELLPLGADQKLKVDLRVVAAVHEDVYARMKSGLFRSDLFHRVAGVTITLPSLAERREDIALIARYYAGEVGCALTNEALALLISLQWPGNVRELKRTIERASVIAVGGVIERAGLLEALDQRNGPESDLLDEEGSEPSADERYMELLQTCIQHGARAPSIAGALGISRATLFRRLKAYGISLSDIQSHQSRPGLALGENGVRL